MTDQEYAKHRGVSRQYVQRLRKEGMIVDGQDGIDAKATDEVLDKSFSASSTTAPSAAKAKMAEVLLKVEHSRFDLAIKQGKYVDVEDQRELWSERASLIRDAVLAIPDRVSPQLVGIESVREIRRKLMAELEAALRACAEEIRTAA